MGDHSRFQAILFIVVPGRFWVGSKERRCMAPTVTMLGLSPEIGLYIALPIAR
jgi:hypothetical protein